MPSSKDSKRTAGGGRGFGGNGGRPRGGGGGGGFNRSPGFRPSPLPGYKRYNGPSWHTGQNFRVWNYPRNRWPWYNHYHTYGYYYPHNSYYYNYSSEPADWENLAYPFPSNWNYTIGQVVQDANGNVWLLQKIGSEGNLYWVLIQPGPNSNLTIGTVTTQTS